MAQYSARPPQVGPWKFRTSQASTPCRGRRHESQHPALLSRRRGPRWSTRQGRRSGSPGGPDQCRPTVPPSPRSWAPAAPAPRTRRVGCARSSHGTAGAITARPEPESTPGRPATAGQGPPPFPRSPSPAAAAGQLRVGRRLGLVGGSRYGRPQSAGRARVADRLGLGKEWGGPGWWFGGAACLGLAGEGREAVDAHARHGPVAAGGQERLTSV